MKYIGKLYGKIAISYFDTGCTSDDYDLLTTSLAEANKQNFQLLQDKVKLEGEIIDLKIDLEHYKKVAQDMSKF